MSIGQWVNIVASIALGLAIASLIQNHGQDDQIEQLRNDRATVQQQIASEQARTRQLEATVQQLLANQAATSASVTTIPTCTLHEIYEQTAHC
ncbi:MAG TPA: hypothetical protein VNO31_31640 [Umezawaea sp.]|nr:hypothetical protein [Umezawaea sp.]